MKAALLGLSLILLAPVAHAQVTIGPGGVTVGRPAIQQDQGDYWRRQREGEREAEWRRRDEYREQEARQQNWQRTHCVRDWQNKEYCRR